MTPDDTYDMRMIRHGLGDSLVLTKGYLVLLHEKIIAAEKVYWQSLNVISYL